MTTTPRDEQSTAPSDADARSSGGAESSASAGVIVALLLAVIAGGVVAVVFALRSGGQAVARIAVTDAPTVARFELDAKKVVSLWAEIDVTHEDISPNGANDDLPHVLDYRVEVTRDGTKVLDLRCNPFNSNFAKWTRKENSIGKPPGRAYDGRIRGCAFDAPPGTYVITAQRDWVGQDPRIWFAKTDLIIRAE